MMDEEGRLDCGYFQPAEEPFKITFLSKEKCSIIASTDDVKHCGFGECAWLPRHARRKSKEHAK